ncbi:uncharacterized protein LOC114312219 [Camellia sinensis]|uniref:uncharacterized protein LOC114312219 n=1 Tax=Camellia sinensis TaxID=4442 RepID=UPI00103643BA|nr:uncharacterized protein LOC114312219 [Camellia sinensis]
MIWALPVPPKLKHFWLRSCNNLLATRQNLHRRKCSTEAMYPVCLGCRESTEHLLCGCSWAKAVLFGNELFLTFWDEIDSLLKRACEVYLAFSNGKDRVSYFCKLLWLAWHVWKSRNAWIFNHTPVDPLETIYLADRARREFETLVNASTSGANSAATVGVPPSVWSPPPQGWLKANCDVAFKDGASKAYIVVLFRDHQGLLVDGAIQLVAISSVMQGEAMAIRRACLTAKARNFSNVEIIGDNKSLILLCV